MPTSCCDRERGVRVLSHLCGVPREHVRAAEFVRWYNDEHRHSGIRYVTPGQRHCGADHAILAARHELYLQARERNPARWSGTTRDWTPIGAVTLNPERDSVVTNHTKADLRQPLAA